MYNKRKWLNVRWRNDKKDRQTFLEISDCMCKVRLHMVPDDSIANFVTKMKKIRDFTDAFIKYLENP